MKLPNFKRLYKGDFAKDFQDLVDQLSVSINIGIENVYDALNKKLTFRDNFACTVKDITVVVDSNGKPTSQTGFPLDITNRIDGVLVINVTNLDNAANYPTGGVYISWVQTSNGILINNITGLQAGQKHSVRIIALGQ